LAGRVDDDGVVVVHDAVEPGVTAVAAPIGNASGGIEASLSLVGPSFRLNGAALQAARRTIADGAMRIESRLSGGA
jgi:DNA-binding IclR family transcriptional regulator